MDPKTDMVLTAKAIASYREIPWQFVSDMSFETCHVNAYKKGYASRDDEVERLKEENNVRNIPLFKIEVDKLRAALEVTRVALNETVSAINEAIGSRPGWTHEHKIRLGYTTLVTAGNAITVIDKALNKTLEPSCPACNEEFSCNVCGYTV